MIYLLSGDEYQSRKKVEQLRQGKRLVSFDMNEDGLDAINARLSSTTLFNEPTLYLISSPKKCKDVDSLLDVLERSVEQEIVILSDLPKNSRIVKLVQDKGKVEVFNAGSVATWVSKEVQNRKINLAPAQQRKLIELVGDDKMTLSNELDKLVFFDEIDNELLERVVPRSLNAEIFALLNAVSAGDRQLTMQIYEDLLKLKTSVQDIVGLLNWQLSVVLTAKLLKRSHDVNTKDLGVNPYSLRNAQPLANKFSEERIKSIINKLFEVDKKSKSSQGGELLVKEFLLEIV